MILALLGLARSAHAAECTGDLLIVLVDPLAYERANDAVLNAFMSVGDAVGGGLGGLITFPLSIGSSSDAWRRATENLREWMTDNGVAGTVDTTAPRRPSGWLVYDNSANQFVQSELVQSRNVVIPWERINEAISVHLDSPHQAVRATTGRGLGWFPKEPHAQANYLVAATLAPWMLQQKMDAFVHLGEGYCG